MTYCGHLQWRRGGEGGPPEAIKWPKCTNVSKMNNYQGHGNEGHFFDLFEYMSINFFFI